MSTPVIDISGEDWQRPKRPAPKVPPSLAARGRRLLTALLHAAADRAARSLELWEPRRSHVIADHHFLTWVWAGLVRFLTTWWDERFWRHAYEHEVWRIEAELGQRWTHGFRELTWKQQVRMLHRTEKLHLERRGMRRAVLGCFPWLVCDAADVPPAPPPEPRPQSPAEKVWSMVERNLGRPLRWVPADVDRDPKS